MHCIFSFIVCFTCVYFFSYPLVCDHIEDIVEATKADRDLLPLSDVLIDPTPVNQISDFEFEIPAQADSGIMQVMYFIRVEDAHDINEKETALKELDIEGTFTSYQVSRTDSNGAVDGPLAVRDGLCVYFYFGIMILNKGVHVRHNQLYIKALVGCIKILLEMISIKEKIRCVQLRHFVFLCNAV